jgi:hypothetical protein
MLFEHRVHLCFEEKENQMQNDNGVWCHVSGISAFHLFIVYKTNML